MAKTLVERFLNNHEPVTESGCWIWVGALSGEYGKMTYNGRTILAHRFSYELADGDLIPSMELHHKCEVKCCVNPDHLEQVTRKEHWAKGTTPSAVFHRFGVCKRGHALTEENVIHYEKTGRKFCRECTHLRDAKRRQQWTPEKRQQIKEYREQWRAKRKAS